MLMPKRVKYRKQFRGSMAGTPTRGTKIAYGEYGLVCTEPVWIRSNQPRNLLRSVWAPVRALWNTG